MAGENRFYRRIITKAILERAERAKGGYIGSLLPSSQPAVGYVLLIGPGDNDEDHTKYREFRVAQLYCRCQAAKIAAPEIKYVVGLALDAKGVKRSSEDLIFLDTTDWTEVDFKRAKQIQADLGYFVPGKRNETHINGVSYGVISLLRTLTAAIPARSRPHSNWIWQSTVLASSAKWGAFSSISRSSEQPVACQQPS